MDQQRTQYHPSTFAQKVLALQQKIFFNAGGPQLMPARYQVNAFKCLSPLWISFLIWYFEMSRFSSTQLYLCLHGSYGIFWVLKDCYFPDKRLESMISVVSQLMLAVLLFGYWCIPVPLMVGAGLLQPSIPRIVAIVVIYVLGLVLMLGSDYQKYKALQIKKGLITTGFFKLTRNPNYLGQFLIYTSFCLCANHILGFIIFYGMGGLVFILNIYLKEQISFKAKLGYQEWAKNSHIFLPKITNYTALEWTIYGVGLAGVILFFAQQGSPYFFFPFDHFFRFLGQL